MKSFLHTSLIFMISALGGPQFRKFRENAVALQFVREAYAAGLLIASFCVGNNTVRNAGLTRP
jgi:putative intracellular protease/amidase